MESDGTDFQGIVGARSLCSPAPEDKPSRLRRRIDRLEAGRDRDRTRIEELERRVSILAEKVVFD